MRSLAVLLAAVLVGFAVPEVARTAGIATVTTLVAEENPLTPIFLPHLTAEVETIGGQPLPEGTLTITRTPDAVIGSKTVAGDDSTLTLWAEGSYWYGDYEFVATYESESGGLSSSATLIVQFRDLDPPLTTVESAGWYQVPEVSVSFTTEEGATSECRLDDGPWEPCASPWTATLADGHYRLEVISTDTAGNRAIHPVGDDFYVDTTPPTGSFTIDGGAKWTRDPVVDVAVDGADNIQDIWRVYYSLVPGVNEYGILDNPPNGSVYKNLLVSGQGTFPIDVTYPFWGGTSADGAKTVYIQFETGSIGQRSEVLSNTIVLDTVAPAATAPSRTFVTGSAISSGKVSVRLGWSGSDATSGIARYELAQSTDSKAWATVSTSLTARSLDRALTPGHTYRFRVRAVDKAGNTGAWATGSTFTLSRYSEASSRIHYSGTWRTATSSVYWGGAARYASAAGAKATFSSTGRSIAWVARRGPTRGKAQVYVNGTKVATIDLYASSYQNQRVVWSTSWSTAATRTVTIRVVGTSGRPRVDLDAIVTGS
jgi:hypothetical protein